jgi:hypothetical protein
VIGNTGGEAGLLVEDGLSAGHGQFEMPLGHPGGNKGKVQGASHQHTRHADKTLPSLKAEDQKQSSGEHQNLRAEEKQRRLPKSWKKGKTG